MSRFGTISPEAKARLDFMEELRKMFYLQVHTEAAQVAQDFTREWIEGDPGLEVKYSGHLAGNYPWLYLDFMVRGRITLAELNAMEARFKKICEQPGASYQDTYISSYQVQFKLIYREDLAYEAKKKGPPGVPEGPQGSGSATP